MKYTNTIPHTPARICRRKTALRTALCLPAMFFLLLLATPLMAGDLSSILLALSLTSTSDKDILTLDFAQPLIPELKILSGASPRVYFEVSPATFWKGKKIYPGTGRFIKQIRTAFYPKKQKIRIVIDLAPPFDYQVEQYVIPTPPRFIITCAGTEAGEGRF